LKLHFLWGEEDLEDFKEALNITNTIRIPTGRTTADKRRKPTSQTKQKIQEYYIRLHKNNRVVYLYNFYILVLSVI